MTSLLVYWRCETIKNVLQETNYKFLMTNRSKLLRKSKCNKILEEGHYKTSKNKYEREREIYENMQILNYAYMQHLETTFGNL